MNPLVISACFAMMVATVAANVLLKLGAAKVTPAGGPWGWLQPEIAASAACFAMAFALYIWVLRHLPLNVAQSLFALQFVGVILAAALILAEPITPLRWVGVGVIALGVLIVAWSNAAT